MRNVFTAAITALIATTIATAASTHHKRAHRHAGHPATTAQRIHATETWRTINNAYGRYEEDYEHYWHPKRPRQTYSAEATWRAQHPDNIWLDFCFVDNYAQCGRDSLENRQRPTP